MRTTTMSPAPVASTFALRSAWVETADRLQKRATALTPSERQCLADMKRPHRPFPRLMERALTIGFKAPLADALAPVRAQEAFVLAHHPALQGLCVWTVIRDESDADAEGAKALADIAADPGNPAVWEAAAEKYQREELAAAHAKAVCYRKARELREQRAAGGLALVRGGR